MMAMQYFINYAPPPLQLFKNDLSDDKPFIPFYIVCAKFTICFCFINNKANEFSDNE